MRILWLNGVLYLTLSLNKIPLKSFDPSHFDMWSLVTYNSDNVLLKQQTHYRYF